MVGFCEVLQQPPRAVIEYPSLLGTYPPHTADVSVILLAVVVKVIIKGPKKKLL